MIRSTLACLGLLAFLMAARADGPGDNTGEKVRPVPPPGGVVAPADRAELEAANAELGRAIDALRAKTNSPVFRHLPDVQIFHNAVRYALAYDEVFNPTNEIPAARELIKNGLERARQLADGKAPWTTQAGLVVRGYVSKIDGAVQPYGLVVPESWVKSPGQRHRLDTWFHGRDEKLSELNFLTGRQKSPGEFVPPHAFVLHLYGRYCNANKFAGEIDLLEALADVQRQYTIDQDRIVIRGFSMGGAACWQFAVHYAGRWAAAAPGAGFAETPDFLRVFQKEFVNPPAYEQALWHWYDCTDYAANLFNLPVVAYSGAIDNQKQAADIMAKAMKAEGLELTHVIGPDTGHKYHPAAKEEVNRRIDQIAAYGRDPVPQEIRFTTWTLRYNEMLWLRVDAMEEHWARARVQANITDAQTITIAADNVAALTLQMPSGLCPLDRVHAPKIVINGDEVQAGAVQSDRSWSAHLRKMEGRWQLSTNAMTSGLAKRHGLQGPVDDAFMDSFAFVTPGGEAWHPKTAAWCKAEQAHAIEHWRKQFRGEARVLRDDAVTDADIAAHNLVLWGDPQSNRLLAHLVAKLPIQWTKDEIRVKDQVYSAGEHMPVLIFPNPLNPERYVVLNSGFTFREYDYLNNARQVAKLPDYAVIDLRQPITPRAPGGIATAGFFNERWELK